MPSTSSASGRAIAANTYTAAARPDPRATLVFSGKDQAKSGSKEPGKDREWAFAVNDKTMIKRGQKTVVAADLKAGDGVTVSYTEHDGKVIAQNVTVRDGGPAKTPVSAREVPAGKK